MIIQENWKKNVVTLTCRDFDEMRGVTAILSVLEGLKSGVFAVAGRGGEQLLSLLEEVKFEKEGINYE